MKQKTIETIHEALKDQLVFAKSALKDIEAKKVQNGVLSELFASPRIHEGVLKCAQERVSRTMEALDDWEAADFTLCGEEPETGCRCENAAANRPVRARRTRSQARGTHTFLLDGSPAGHTARAIRGGGRK